MDFERGQAGLRDALLQVHEFSGTQTSSVVLLEFSKLTEGIIFNSHSDKLPTHFIILDIYSTHFILKQINITFLVTNSMNYIKCLNLLQ